MNGLLWLDPVLSGVNYTYYADTNRQHSLIDHMLVSPHLIGNQESVDILVDDHNASDYYAISVSLKTESTNMKNDNLSKCKTLKYMWNTADVYGYAKVLGKHLSTVVLPKTALMCNGSCRNGCVESFDRYYNSDSTVFDNCI